MKRFSITMPDEVLEALEKQRGKTPRSTYIAKVIQATTSTRTFPMVISSKDELLELAQEVQATERSLEG
jgi:hypothetical protein